MGDCDVDYYMLRYSPNLNDTWESSTLLQNSASGNDTISVQARTGTYFIKAIDWNGNESSEAALAITSIPNLVNLNIIEETNDFPLVPGVKDRVEYVDGALTLQVATPGPPQEFYSEGYYYYEDILDLGEIYTVRIQSLIEAKGLDSSDLIVNWVTLDDVVAMETNTSSQWNVISQYRSSDVFNVMGEWNALTDVATLDAGVQSNWTEWRSFSIGDFTGRLFQFRLKLISNKASVTPRVINGVIKSDMVDRIEVQNNIVSSGVTSVVYEYPFKGPGTTPNIQITQDDAQQGDYFKITNKTLSGFDIEFFDKDNNSVSRQFDTAVKGYGRNTLNVI